MSAARERRLALLSLAVLALVWGYNWVVMKVGLRYASPGQFLTLRFVGGGLALLLLGRFTGQSIRLPAEEVRAVIVCSLVTALNFLLMMCALALGAAGKTAVLVYTMPFWVVLLSARLLDEQISRRQWRAIAACAGGLLLLIAPWKLAGGWAASLLATVAGLLWAAGLVSAKQIQARGKVSTHTLSLYQMLAGVLVSLIALLLLPGRPIDWTPTLVLAASYNVLLGTVLAWWLLYYALARLPAGTTGLATLATPVVGVLSAWFAMGERPQPLDGWGMGFTAGGLVLLYWPVRRS